jgi:hypothetical protein
LDQVQEISARLRELGSRSKPTPEQRTEVETLLDSKWAGVQVLAERALGNWGDPRSAAVLRERMLTGKGSQEIPKALGNCVGEADVPWVLDLFFKQPSYEWRLRPLVAALTRTSTVARLRDLAKQGDSDHREAARRALRWMGADNAPPADGHTTAQPEPQPRSQRKRLPVKRPPAAADDAYSPSRAHVRTREDRVPDRHHAGMASFPRCAARLRDGRSCDRTVADGSEFCVHHSKLLATVDAGTMRQGRTPKKRSRSKQALRAVPDETVDAEATAGAMTIAVADPASVRPSLAVAAAENVEQLKTSLLEAAGSAVKPVWLTVECTACGERSRIEAPVPDVRARVAAIELLLREGLGRPATAEEVRPPRLPASAEAVKAMSWHDMQHLFAALYVDEIAAVERDGGEALVRRTLAGLSDGQRRVLREALAEPDVRSA